MAESLMERFNKFKESYLMEKHRIESYKDWPYDESLSCSVTKMAEAGFYWSGSKHEDDATTCFVCGKTLHGWDPDDNPWKEHTKHAPQCLFVKYGHKEKDLTVSTTPKSLSYMINVCFQVEEFLNIFGIVVKNKMEKNMQNVKTNFTKVASEELESFVRQKKV